jgi:DNA-directed RNA polymerase specialized sigma24 family protein
MGVTATPEAPRASNTVDELYRKHGAEVYRYAYGVVGNRPDAEDVTQSTFVNALPSSGDAQTRSSEGDYYDSMS